MCMIDSADGAWTVLSDTNVKRARTTHRCYECYRTIEVGESYRRVVAVDEYGLSRMAHCPQCSTAAQWLERVCDGWLWGGVLEDLEEHWSEEPEYRTHGLGRRIIGMRRRWRRRDGTLYTPEEIRSWPIRFGSVI